MRMFVPTRHHQSSVPLSVAGIEINGSFIDKYASHNVKVAISTSNHQWRVPFLIDHVDVGAYTYMHMYK